MSDYQSPERNEELKRERESYEDLVGKLGVAGAVRYNELYQKWETARQIGAGGLTDEEMSEMHNFENKLD